MVDRPATSGGKWFHTRLRRVWNRYITYESHVSIYHNQGALSLSPMKAHFNLKTPRYRRVTVCFTVLVQIRKCRGVARVVMVTPRRLLLVQNNVCAISIWTLLCTHPDQDQKTSDILNENYLICNTVQISDAKEPCLISSNYIYIYIHIKRLRNDFIKARGGALGYHTVRFKKWRIFNKKQTSTKLSFSNNFHLPVLSKRSAWQAPLTPFQVTFVWQIFSCLAIWVIHSGIITIIALFIFIATVPYAYYMCRN